MKTQSGITLLEVLITLVVIAIGMLGMASLQLGGLRSNHNAYYRSQATGIAADLTDRMRSNVGAARSGAYAAQQVPDDPGYDCQTSFPNGTGCTPAELAAADLYAWYQMLGSPASGLPGAVATVSCAAGCAAGDPYTISLTWDENRNGQIDADYVAATQSSGAVEADPVLNVVFAP
ncbi:type IV pilus modification protein PilV [Abyssibacter sp.]|jgi:type IV pilus assembly protein PilV|uniref:type IV pilus modification protein PilV n=1 Tax=Abyssibacter sp. TaxID=2320200 RepID=UPI0025C039AB|nr:type IV pilus modification protein PilV [Abyssibacter sp.]MCK5860813.1 type IV pilus modification protein PilV [Abyssibacter sp.]